MRDTVQREIYKNKIRLYLYSSLIWLEKNRDNIFISIYQQWTPCFTEVSFCYVVCAICLYIATLYCIVYIHSLFFSIFRLWYIYRLNNHISRIRDLLNCCFFHTKSHFFSFFECTTRYYIVMANYFDIKRNNKRI